jgi:hypothetical protein
MILDMRSVRKCNVLLSKGRLVPTCLETDGCEPCRSANRFEPMIFEAACRQSDSVCFIRLASSLAIDSCNRFLVLRLTPSSRVVRCFCFVPIAQLNQMAFLLLVEFSTTPSADRVLIDSQLNRETRRKFYERWCQSCCRRFSTSCVSNCRA